MDVCHKRFVEHVNRKVGVTLTEPKYDNEMFTNQQINEISHPEVLAAIERARHADREQLLEVSKQSTLEFD